jgi:hypothetical protein
LNSWVTLRTHDGSVGHISAICEADLFTFDANSTAARCRVHRCFVRFDRTASSRSYEWANTAGGRIASSTVEMHPIRHPRQFSVQRCLKGHWKL